MEDCGLKLFVGLDVSLGKTATCVISEQGKIVKEAQVASEAVAPLRWIGDLDGAIAAVRLGLARCHSGCTVGRQRWDKLSC